MPTPSVPPSPVALLIREHFPGARFLTQDLKLAGRKLKNGSIDDTLAYLQGKQWNGPPPNFQPPVKCLVVAQSRPFDQWPIYDATTKIQTFFYGLRVSELDSYIPEKNAASHRAWFAKTGVRTQFWSVQAQNKMFDLAAGIYRGVLKKVENRNERIQKKMARINEKRAMSGLKLDPVELDTALDEKGRLLHPPGVNRSIYIYQQASPVAVRDTRSLQGVPETYRNYTKDPTAVLNQHTPDRLGIPKGAPGYIPDHLRPFVRSSSHRRRKSYAAANHKPKLGRTSKVNPVCLAEMRAADALLVRIKIDDDWALIDVRGLLRDARRRGVMPDGGVSLEGLLGLFTGDPVIDTQRGFVTFCYKPAVVGIVTREPVEGKRTRAAILEHLHKKGTTALVSIDLGQTNLLAFKISRASIEEEDHTEEEQVAVEHVYRDLLDRHILSGHTQGYTFHQYFDAYRCRLDALNQGLHNQAVASLTPEQQEEIHQAENQTADNARQRLCVLLQLDPACIPWEDMTSVSTHISNAVLLAGVLPSSTVLYVLPPKKSKQKDHLAGTPKKSKKDLTEPVKRRDYAWSKMGDVRLMLREETRKALNEAEFKLMRESKEYGCLSRQKTEMARRAINYIVAKARDVTSCSDVITNLENLNVGFFHGSGKRKPGWNEFFVPKRENRWFIQALHKACVELAHHRGYLVTLSNPRWTSLTCSCGYCDRENRCHQDRNRFECRRCGIVRHADLDIATDNIELVAITGESLPGPCEQSADEKKTGTARTARKPSNLKQKKEAALVSALSVDPPDTTPYRTARDSVYNHTELLSP